MRSHHTDCGRVGRESIVAGSERLLRPLASGSTYDPPVSIWVAAELTCAGSRQFLRPSVVLDGPLATGDLSPTPFREGLFADSSYR